MKVVLIISVIMFLVFYVGPAIVGFQSTFSRFECEAFDTKDISGTVFEPFREMYKEKIPELKSYPHEQVEITNDGIKLVGDFYDFGCEDTMVFVHGFCSNKYSSFAKQASDLAGKMNLLLIEQRAHNGSGGKWLTFGVKEQYDVQKWTEWAAVRTKGRIFLYGISMGAATVLYASDKVDDTKVKGIIADCGYKSPWTMMYDMGVGKYTVVKLLTPCMCFLARVLIKFNPHEKCADSLKNTKIPVLFIHGTADTKVPIHHSCYNYDACASDKEKYFVEGAPHAVAYLYGGEEARRKVEDFIDRRK